MVFGISFSFKERSNLCTIKPTSVESVGKFCMTKLSLNSVPQAVVGHCASWMTIGSAPGDQQPQGRSSPGGLILVRMRRVGTIITCFYMLYRLTLWMRPRSELFRKSNSLRSSLGSIVHNSRWHALQWHNGRDVVSNHRRLVCLLNHLFSRRKKSKLRITGLCEGNPHKRPITQKMFRFDDVIMGMPWDLAIFATLAVWGLWYLGRTRLICLLEMAWLLAYAISNHGIGNTG